MTSTNRKSSPNLAVMIALAIGASLSYPPVHAAGNAERVSVQDCSAPVNLVAPTKFDVERGKHGHLLVDVEMGETTARAVIDTGGMGTGGLISKDLMLKQGLEENRLDPITAHGAHAASAMQMLVLDRVSMAGASVDNLTFIVTPEPVMPDEGVAALIGSRFLCQFLVEFDFAGDQVGLYSRDTVPQSIISGDGDWLELSFENFYGTGGILFEVELNGVAVKAALDTGSPHTGINWKAAALAGVSPDSRGLRKIEVAGHGLIETGPVSTHEYGFDLSVAGGRFPVRDERVRIKDINAFKQIFGDQPGVILGLNFFAGRRLLIDYANEHLYLSQPGDPNLAAN